MSTKKAEILVKKNALRELQIADLGVDPSYQRGVTPGAKRIAKNYNPVSFGVPLVGQRDDGSLWVVDGQQRIEALKIMGRHKNVRCEVFASRGPEHEAQVFKEVNKNRTALDPLQIYHAMLTAGDETCWKIKELVEKHGFTIPKSNSKGTKENPDLQAVRFGCVGALAKAYDQGEDALEFICQVIKQVWPGDRQRTKDAIVHGLRIFYNMRKKVVDLERLVPRLNASNPSKILYSAGLGVSDTRGNVAAVIESLYRKKSVKK